MEIERESPRAHEVTIDVLYCGVCHSDIHQVKNEWDNTVYPCVPGHEIVGRVSALGGSVSRWSIGDLVGVGCMLDSCRTCEPCQKGEPNYCEGPNSWLGTYNGPMVPKEKAPSKENAFGRDNTFGGYSARVVVPEDFVLRIPPRLRPEAAAPLLCAGVTTYAPLKRFGVERGQRVGVVGLGGLGHLAVRLARAMGAQVFAFSTTPDKKHWATRLGAEEIISEGDEEAFSRLANSFDLILSTVPQKHDINAFLQLLKRDKTLVILGALEPMAPVDNMAVALHRKTWTSSLIGSLAETQEVLELCAMHHIEPDVELIRVQELDKAFARVEAKDVRFRFVLDMASLSDD